VFSVIKQEDLKQKMELMYCDLIDMDILRDIQMGVLQEMDVQLSAGHQIEDLAQEFKVRVLEKKNELLNANTKPRRHHDHARWKEFQDEVAGEAVDEVDDDDMEDVQFDSQKISLKCPITKTTFVDPVMNPACKHVYSRAAIAQLMDRGHAEVFARGRRLTSSVSRSRLQKDGCGWPLSC